MGVVYIYFNRESQADQRATDVVRSLLKQLAYQLVMLSPRWQTNTDPQTVTGWLKLVSAYHNRDYVTPNAEALLDIFLECSQEFFKVFIVLDALDACENHERGMLTPYLQKFLHHGLKLYYTTRLDLQLALESKKINKFANKC